MSGKLGDEFEGRILSEPPVLLPGFTALFASIAGEGSIMVRAGRNFCDVLIPLKPAIPRSDVTEFVKGAQAHASHHDGDAGTLVMYFAFRARNGDMLPGGHWEEAPAGHRLRATLSPRTDYRQGPWREVTAG